MNFFLDRFIGLSYVGLGSLPLGATTATGTAKFTLRFMIGLLVAGVINIVIGLIFATILAAVFRLKLEVIDLALPPTLVIQEGLLTILIGILLATSKKLIALIFITLRFFALFLIYWQLKISVWLVATIAGSRIPFIKEGEFAWLQNVFPAFHDAMAMPGYAALITVVGLIVYGLLTKRPISVHFSPDISGTTRI